MAALALLTGSAYADATLKGEWQGEWTRDGDALPVTMRFATTSSGWTGSFDSDRLSVVGIPLQEIVVDLPRVQWNIVGDATVMRFSGELRDDGVRGTFREGERSGTFFLRRATRTAALPEREVVFRNGEISLAGTLVLPETRTGRVGAIVFLHGSGPEGRWASKYLASRFARAGMAALIYDKRGVGQSKGDWRTSSLDDLVGDAVAAIAAARAQPEVDPRRVGIYGHSQGGTLAPLIATRAGGVAFVIASAAAGVPTRDVEIYSIANAVGVSRLSPQEAAMARDYIQMFVATAYEGLPRQTLLQAWETNRDKPWALKPPPPDDYYWSFSRQFGAYDPIANWRQISAPVLLIYGGKDERVPPRASAAAIAAAVLDGNGGNISVRIFPDADHTLRVPATGVWPKPADGHPDAAIAWVERIMQTPHEGR